MPPLTPPDPAGLLQDLVRFDTSNPPGNEAACARHLERLLSEAGVQADLYSKDPDRPSLVARLRGSGSAPPFLMYGHTDVVPVSGQTWRHPPFEARIEDGFIWGRGAVDMKSALAMMATSLVRLAAEGYRPPGDIVFAAVADEESGGEFGAAYLVENHPELFEGVKYAIGEVGGFTTHIAGRRIYPVTIAEKQACWLRLTFRGKAGHGALATRGGAMAKAARAVSQIEATRLPVHITGPAKAMLNGTAGALPRLQGIPLRLLARRRLTDPVLRVLGDRGAIFDPLLHNTVTPTVIRGGERSNVVPETVTLELDGRILPGLSPDDLIRELRDVVGQEPEIEVMHYDPGPPATDTGLFETMTGVLGELDPGSRATPFLLGGTTDARFFARLGIQTYGFTPMKLPPQLDFASLFHGPDERIPVEAVHFGTDAIYRLLKRL